MSVIEIYRNRHSRDVAIVPFATGRGEPDAASGKLVHLSAEQFPVSGGVMIRNLLENAPQFDGVTKSELYNEMSSQEKRRFLKMHTKAVVWFRRGEFLINTDQISMIARLPQKCTDTELLNAVVKAWETSVGPNHVDG